MDAAAAQAFLWNLATDDDVEDIPECSEVEDKAGDDTARLPASKRQKLRKCLGLGRPHIVARQVKELPEVSEEDDEEGVADGEAHSPHEDAFTSNGAECGGTRHASGNDSDFEKEQRVNAELKERYRSLTQAAAIDISDEEDEEVEEAVAPPTSDAQPAAGNRAQEAACDIPAEQAAAGRKLKLKVTPQAGASRLLRIGAHEPLSKLFAAFQQHAVSACSMPADAQPSFWFDGEKLSGEATAEGLELEDDFVIDCKW